MAGAAAGAKTAWLSSVGAGAVWMTSAVGAGAAWAVSNTGEAEAAASLIGALNAAEGEVWTGLAAAVLIASALAETGAPVWLPVLKLWARSVGERLTGA